MATPPVSVDETATFLKLTRNYDDVLLEQFLNAATVAVEKRCGPMTAVEVEASFRVGTGGRVLLRPYPVLSVDTIVHEDAVTVTQNTVRSDLSIGELIVDQLGWITVTFTAGRDPVPDDLITATQVVTGHLWETQRGTQSRPGLVGGGGDVAIGAEASQLVLRGFALPRRAQELMQPYMQ